MIPNTYGVLDRLGLLPQMRASHFPEKYSVRFVAPSGDESDPFYFFESLPREQAQTWQVLRSEFDQMCLRNAQAAGVEVRMGARVAQVLFDGTKASGVSVHFDDDEPVEIAANVVVDASGRATVLGRQLGLRAEVPQLNKATVWGYFRGAKRRDGIDAGETTVFMIRDRGWFWVHSTARRRGQRGNRGFAGLPL